MGGTSGRHVTATIDRQPPKHTIRNSQSLRIRLLKFIENSICCSRTLPSAPAQESSHSESLLVSDSFTSVSLGFICSPVFINRCLKFDLLLLLCNLRQIIRFCLCSQPEPELTFIKANKAALYFLPLVSCCTLLFLQQSAPLAP